MRYYTVVYNTSDGRISEYVNSHTPYPIEQLPVGHALLQLNKDEKPTPRTHSVDVATLTLLNEPSVEPIIVLLADWQSIKQYRNQFDTAPIEIPEGNFDVANDSIKRMERAQKTFNKLPKKKNGKVQWKRADNSITELNAAQLRKIIDDVEEAQAIRSDILYAKAEEFRTMNPAPTLDFISKLNNWTD